REQPQERQLKRSPKNGRQIMRSTSELPPSSSNRRRPDRVLSYFDTIRTNLSISLRRTGKPLLVNKQGAIDNLAKPLEKGGTRRNAVGDHGCEPTATAIPATVAQARSRSKSAQAAARKTGFN